MHMNWNDYFIADFEAGVLTWKDRMGGKRAGWIDYRGYWRVELFGTVYRAHRILYEMANGPVPEGFEIDHKDRDKANNRRSNLRLATKSENGRNRGPQSNNTSGVKGVSWNKGREKWEAHITHNGRQKHLGLYTDINDAIAARRAAELKYHGEFAPNY